MTTTTQPVTAEELLNMPDDGFRYELIRGELRKMPPAGHIHGEYALSIGASLLTRLSSGVTGPKKQERRLGSSLALLTLRWK